MNIMSLNISYSWYLIIPIVDIINMAIVRTYEVGATLVLLNIGSKILNGL